MADATVDLGRLEDRLKALTVSADRFGSALTGALKAAIVDGKELDDVLRAMLLQLSSSALEAALKPLSQLIGDLAGSLTGSLGSTLGGLVGGTSAATATGAAASSAVAATAEPVAGAGRTTVVFNVTTPDAESFRRSEAQVGGMLARAVGRGRRGL